jgi:uncharacterized protein
MKSNIILNLMNMTVASPCTSLCQMDEKSKLCKGCLRMIEEIIVWSSIDDSAKTQVLLLIEQRKLAIDKANQKVP